MHKRFIQIASLFGAMAVILGAFGAHALKNIYTDKMLQTYEVGVRYQMYHVIALLLAGILFKEYPNKFMRWAGNLFISGILLFSGSLYLLSFFQYKEMLGWYKIGAITPLGGVCFIAGWILVARAIAGKK